MSTNCINCVVNKRTSAIDGLCDDCRWQKAEIYKCPHCGEVFAQLLPGGLVPTHDYPKLCRQVCLGAGEYGRGIADKRPLWKDEKHGM